MALSRVFGQASTAAMAQCRRYFFLSPPLLPPQHRHFSLLSTPFLSLSAISNKASTLNHRSKNVVPFPHCGMSTSTTTEQEQGTPSENKETVENEEANGKADAGAQAEAAMTADGKPSEETSETDSRRGLEDLSKEDLIKLVLEKEQALELKEKEFEVWKDRFLRSYAEMENVMQRTRREVENSKKFAIQSFAKSLLDVADNLGRAASVTKESFSKIDASKDTIGAVPILKTLLEGVEMTDKQLEEVFRKYGIEKYDPINEQFDPNRHNAVFQVPDNSKPPGTVAVVLKSGYMLHDRIIRPAEVGVTVAVENKEANSEAAENKGANREAVENKEGNSKP
ncbi:hypothetical protein Cgig2_020609 [Carnegiea gigantea]|uniref:GrpE protein homolog n=1 Tax=Carnegiea gigantea TaxID=171969 RepID=A0A9Q1JXZ4_9CARY|nr:hypothetical protein Cgig2_020609 [Carnegiea gigantea]